MEATDWLCQPNEMGLIESKFKSSKFLESFMTLQLPGRAKTYLQSCITNFCSKMFTLPDVYMVCVMSSKLKAAGVAQIYTAADRAAASPAAGQRVNTPSENAKQRLPVRLPALFYNLCIQPRLNSVTALPNRLYPS